MKRVRRPCWLLLFFMEVGWSPKGKHGISSGSFWREMVPKMAEDWILFEGAESVVVRTERSSMHDDLHAQITMRNSLRERYSRSV